MRSTAVTEIHPTRQNLIANIEHRNSAERPAVRRGSRAGHGWPEGVDEAWMPSSLSRRSVAAHPRSQGGGGAQAVFGQSAVRPTEGTLNRRQECGSENGTGSAGFAKVPVPLSRWKAQPTQRPANRLDRRRPRRRAAPAVAPASTRPSCTTQPPPPANDVDPQQTTANTRFPSQRNSSLPVRQMTRN